MNDLSGRNSPQSTDAARTHRERVDDVNRIKGLLYEGSLPWDEQSPNALMVTVNGQGGAYFIGRENFTAAGELMGTAPLTSAEIVKKIDAEKVRRVESDRVAAPERWHPDCLQQGCIKGLHGGGHCAGSECSVLHTRSRPKKPVAAITCGETHPHDRHEFLVGFRRHNCPGVPGCTGSRWCKAETHIHGCFADRGSCDQPGEHHHAAA